MRRIRSLEDEENLTFNEQTPVNNSNKRVQSLIVLFVLVAIWYSTAVVAITTSKEIMNRARFPFLLCTIQFFFATAITYIYLYLTKSIKTISPAINNILYQISFSYTLGFVFTNTAFSMGKYLSSQSPLLAVELMCFSYYSKSSICRNYQIQ